MFNLLITMIAMIMPFHHATPAVTPAPATIVAPTVHAAPPAPLIPHITSVPVATPAPAPKPVAVEGPQPVGPSVTYTPQPSMCVVTVTGTLTQNDGGPVESSSSPVTFSMSCDQANAYAPPAGTTDTVTPEPSSDTMTTGASS